MSFFSCEFNAEQEDPDNPVIAEVFNQRLTAEDLKPLLQTEVSVEDSTLYARSLIEKWVREAILMHEAERNIPADLDIQKMVNDYRSSLILMTYRQQLVEENLDTSVTQAQLEAYYEDQKTQFKLSEHILSGIFLKIKKDSPNFERLDKLWKDKKYHELSEEDDNLFEVKLTDPYQWYTWKDLNALFPKSFWNYNDLKSKDAKSKSSGNFKYYIKVSAYEDKNEIAPLSYIKDQAAKVILHKRQTELFDNLMQELYDKYSNNNNVKINI